MTEEIKRIIDYLKRSDKNKFGFEQDKLIDYEEAQLLLDYITNLQQLYENALKVNQNENKYRTELESKYVLLQQTLHNITINGVEEENTTVLDLINENKKLKECYCNRTDCSGRIKDSKKYNSVYQEKESYKSKCEKAIGRISLLKMDDITIETNKALDYVLKPLIGSDENETK